MPIYNKNPSNFFFLQNQRASCSETLYVPYGMQPIVIYTKCDPSLSLRYFTPRSSLVTLAFVWKKLKLFIFQKLLQPMISKLVATLN